MSPTIEITDEQARALERGEAITIDPKPVAKHFIAVARCGVIYEYSTHDGKPQPWTLVRSIDNRFFPAGYTSSDSFPFDEFPNDYTVVEVEK